MSVSNTAAALTPAIFQRNGSRDARAPSDRVRTFLRCDTTVGDSRSTLGCSKETIHGEDGHPDQLTELLAVCRELQGDTLRTPGVSRHRTTRRNQLQHNNSILRTPDVTRGTTS